jgi:large subunit ribosomal protein L11
MSKVVKTKVKIQLMGGAANPSQIGKEMGPHGINLMKFCTDFNAGTGGKKGQLCPAVVTIYVDKTFEIEYKTPPASYLIAQAAGIAKGSSKPGKTGAGKITKDQVMEIARGKMIDLNTMSLENAYKSIVGTARSMGIEVV